MCKALGSIPSIKKRKEREGRGRRKEGRKGKGKEGKEKRKLPPSWWKGKQSQRTEGILVSGKGRTLPT
jgi:hypothetical protein